MNIASLIASLSVAALLAAPALAADPHAGHNHSESAAAVHQGRGVVKKIEREANRITLDHDAMPSLEWPRMTMVFSAAPGAIPKDLQIGDKVGFTLQMKGRAGTITAMEKR